MVKRLSSIFAEEDKESVGGIPRLARRVSRRSEKLASNS